MFKEIPQKINSFFAQSVRVWHVLRKPSKDEFWTVAKVSALGIVVIGLIGFFVSILINLVKP
jgi:protein transport protein SEC61 subunit gamma and related proteins